MSRLMIKPIKRHVRPVKTQIGLGICPVWSVFAVRMKKLGSLVTHWAHSEESDQTGWMPRLIRVFAGCTVILLVLSCGGSDITCRFYASYEQRSLCINTIWYDTTWHDTTRHDHFIVSSHHIWDIHKTFSWNIFSIKNPHIMIHW